MAHRKLIIRAFTVSRSLGFVKGLLPSLMREYDVKLLCSPDKPLSELINEYSTDIIPVTMYRRFSPLKDIKSLISIIRVFYREKPDMVHSMTPKAGLLCMVAAWVTRVPVRVHTFTGLVFPTAKGISRQVLMFSDRITCGCATHVIPEGEGVKNDLQHYRITKKPLSVLGYGNVRGVDMIRFNRTLEVEEHASLLRDPGILTFLYVGRIVRDKGIDELVKAFHRLHNEYNNVRLFLVGGYEEELDPISPLTHELITSDSSIISVGRKTGNDLLAFYASADCFVLPSYREGFPNVVLEAGAMDLPCIVTDINGSREIITSGYNGLVIPSHSTDALYLAMKQMIDNPEERKKMGSVSRTYIASHYEQGFVRQCLLDYYKQIL